MVAYDNEYFANDMASNQQRKSDSSYKSSCFVMNKDNVRKIYFLLFLTNKNSQILAERARSCLNCHAKKSWQLHSTEP